MKNSLRREIRAARNIQIEPVDQQLAGMKEYVLHAQGCDIVEAHQFRYELPITLAIQLRDRAPSKEAWIRAVFAHSEVAKVIPDIAVLENKRDWDIDVLTPAKAFEELVELVFDGPIQPEIWPREITSEDDAVEITKLLFDDISKGNRGEVITWRVNSGWSKFVPSCIYFWLYPHDNLITVLFYADGS